MNLAEFKRLVRESKWIFADTTVKTLGVRTTKKHATDWVDLCHKTKSPAKVRIGSDKSLWLACDKGEEVTP